jgi:hypothetical protein
LIRAGRPLGRIGASLRERAIAGRGADRISTILIIDIGILALTDPVLLD